MLASERLTVLCLSALLTAVVLVSSCHKAPPTACFEVVTLADSMIVGRNIQFDPQCSSGATKYYWDFGNRQTSNSSGIVQTVYDSAATYPVSLVVSNGSNTASITRSVTIMP